MTKSTKGKSAKKTTSSRMKQCIISIDVGVKNLAICVLGEYEKSEVQILLWKWYNVLSGDSSTPSSLQGVPSSSPLKTTKKIKDDMSYGLCQTTIKKTKKPCGVKGVINSRGRAYCGRHDPAKKHTPSDTQQWCHGMLQSLPNITKDIFNVIKDACPTTEDMYTKVRVIIEQQAMDNKKILLQSHLIFGHFVTMFDNRVPVRFIPAYNKLLVYDGPEITPTLKTPYSQRKFLAKKYTEYYLQKFVTLNKWKVFFDSCKTKQDDISDAFLQGLYIIKGTAKEPQDVLGIKQKRRRRKVRF